MQITFYRLFKLLILTHSLVVYNSQATKWLELSTHDNHNQLISAASEIDNHVIEPPADQLAPAASQTAPLTPDTNSMIMSMLINSANKPAAGEAPLDSMLSNVTQKPPIQSMDLVAESSRDQLELINVTHSPKSDKAKVLEMFNKFFIRARSHDDQSQKEYVRDGVILRLRELGFETSFLQKSRFEFRRRPAFSYNMISILPGKHRQTKKDRIVLVGAHWDSATKAPVSFYVNSTVQFNQIRSKILIYFRSLLHKGS